MPIYSSRIQINTPGAPRQPRFVFIVYLLLIHFKSRRAFWRREGNWPHTAPAIQRQFGNQAAGVLLCQIKNPPHPLHRGHSGFVHEGSASEAHQSLTSSSIFCLFNSNRPGRTRPGVSLRPPVWFSGPQLWQPQWGDPRGQNKPRDCVPASKRSFWTLSHLQIQRQLNGHQTRSV